jgi:two-component system cell cycle response regulator
VTIALATVAALVAGLALGVVVTRRRMRRYVHEAERSRAEYRRALDRLGEALGVGDDRTALVGVVLQAGIDLAGADGAVFWAGGGPKLVARAASGVDAGILGRSVPRGAGLVGWTAQHGQASRWPPAAHEPAPGEPPCEGALAVPLSARGGLYGVLALYKARGTFDSQHLDDLNGLARQAEAALDTTFVHDEAKRLSLTDGLTGLWNRRQLELRMTQEQERAARFGERFSVVLIDLDDFKAINDTHGHPVGDAVLVEAARRLDAHTREVDVVARYGGEEFALLLPQTELDGAVLVAEKIRAELGDVPVMTEAGPLHVTMSAGVACHPHHGTGSALLAAADAALYAAKSGGKNQVVATDVPSTGAASS